MLNTLARTQWTPELLDATVWLDASVSNSITLVSGRVSQWSDLSGNGYHAYGSDVAYRPEYVSNKVVFNGTWLKINNYPNPTLQTTVLISQRTGSPSNAHNNIAFMLSSGVANSSSEREMQFTYNDSGVFTYGLRFGVANGLSLVQTRDDNLNIHYMERSYGAEKTATYALNENNKQSGTYTASAVGTPILMGIGSGGTWSAVFPATWAQQGLMGYIYELIMFSYILNEKDREKLTGYLSQKYGVSSNLPVSHNYRDNTPRGL